MSTYIIAEIGPNHNGSLSTAIEMLESLADIGVDAVKFQLANPHSLYSKDSFKAEYQKSTDINETALEMSKKNQLTHDEHQELSERCQKLGIDYLCTAFDLESLKFLNEKIDIKYFKIPSGEIFSLDLIEYISQFNKPIILSTGMSTYDEIEYSINLLNNNFKKDIKILHCVSNYPAQIGSVNLRNITGLQKRFNYPVGFSDHTIGNHCSIAAVALGAEIIEKHVTYDKNAVGPDHKASATIDEFKNLVDQLRGIEKSLGDEKRNISNEEKETYNVARKSIVSARNLPKGTVISNEDICFKRPGTGFLPIDKDEVIGKKVISEILEDRLINSDDIE